LGSTTPLLPPDTIPSSSSLNQSSSSISSHSPSQNKNEINSSSRPHTTSSSLDQNLNSSSTISYCGSLEGTRRMNMPGKKVKYEMVNERDN